MKEILIDEIVDSGLTIEATSDDSWVGLLLKDALDDDYDEKVGARLAVRIVRFEDNVTIDGSISFNSICVCDRCLKAYSGKSEVKVHTVLLPATIFASRHSEEEIELVEEDLEFSPYRGDRFDLADVIREQIVLAQPMKNLCSDDCAGLCQKCGQNLNDTSCDCDKRQVDPRWEALKGFRRDSGKTD